MRYHNPMTDQAPILDELELDDSEMQELSLDAFNSKHRWKKILTKGMLMPVDDAFSKIEDGRIKDIVGQIMIYPSRHELAVYMQKVVDHKNEKLAKVVESREKEAKKAEIEEMLDE